MQATAMRVIKKSVTVGILIAFITGSQAIAGSQAKFPPSSKVYFVLDTSSSTNTVSLWKEKLRPSILAKIPSSFGRPQADSKSKDLTPKSPLDITVTYIGADSYESKLFQIAKASNAQGIWQKIYDKTNDGSEDRMRYADSAFFGASGVYGNSIDRYLSSSSAIQSLPPQSDCKKHSLHDLQTANWVKNLDGASLDNFATSICGHVYASAQELSKADAFFEHLPACTGKCSDIIGIISQIADDAAGSVGKMSQIPGKPNVCIAIASDMVNIGKYTTASSKQDTRKAVMSANSLADAKAAGAKAAVEAGILFPSKNRVSVSVNVIGMGGSSDGSGVPRNKLNFLRAYWDGFWNAVGVNSVERSLTEACS